MPTTADSGAVRRSVVSLLRAAGCVFAEDEAELLISAAATPADLDATVAERVAGRPLEHVLGWAEFCGMRIAVEPGVFVPRRRTEFLAQQALVLIAEHTGGPAVVVDLCCGSGAVGVAVSAAAQPVELHAADIDPVAVRCARQNLAALGGRVYEGDLYSPLPATLRGRVDLLIANAPYVPTDEIGRMPAEARIHEPRVALDGGADGLDILRRVTSAAPDWLAPGGHLLIETSERQAARAVAAAARSGLLARVARSDELTATVLIARSSLHDGTSQQQHGDEGAE